MKDSFFQIVLKINSQRIQFHKMQSSNVFTLGDVADILDSALDTGISIVDALAKLSELADQGKVDRQKCYNKLKLEDTYQTIHVSNKVTYYPPCFGNADNDNESVRQLHDTVYEDTHANSQKQSHAQVDVSSDDRNNNSVVMRSRTKKPAAGKRSTYVLDSSPIKSAKEAAMQGIPIIQALGDLCSVTDNFLKDYDDEVENNSPENNDDAPSRHVILENEINSKVNEILYSFQQLDSTVDMLTKDALNNANYEYREYDADSIISARFSTAQNEDSCFSEDNLPNYATQYSSDLISVNAQPVKHVLTKGDSLTSTNDQPPRASSNEDADMSSAVIRRHKTRSSRPKTCIITEKPMFSSEHDFRLTQTLEATSVVSDHKLDTVDSINQSKLLTNSRRLNLSDCTLGNDIENKSTRDFDFKRHEPPVERRSAKKYTSNWNRGTFVISSSVHCTDAEVTLCEHVGKVEKLSDNDSRDSESTLDESEGDAETDVQNQNLKNVSSNRGVFLSKERAGSHLSLRKPQVDSHTNASCPTLYPNPVRQFSTESILSLPRQLGSNLFENCLSFTDELSNVSPACSQEDTNLSLERSSSMTDLSSAHTYENELHQQKYSLISQSLLDFKKTASMSNHVSNSLADRTQSQPLLSDDKDTSRKTSVGNVINKLGMLHKVMFTSLSKLTELHAVKREVYLSQSSVDTINNDDDSDIPIQQTRFSLSGSVGNHLGGKSIFADDHQNIGYYHRSISAPNAGDEVYKNMIRQYSNSSGETYTLISPPNDIVEKDSSLVLIDFNESDNEESSERVFIHSFAGEEDWIEDSPRSYHFETDFMTPAEVSDDTGAELMNVKGIIQSLEQEWSDKISTKYIKDEETLRDSHQTASDHVTISQGPKTVDNRFLNQTYYPSDTSHHFYSSNSLYSEVSNDRISAGNESEEPAENAFVTGIQTVTLRDRSGLTPKPRVATYVLETSKTQVAGIPSRDESQPFNDTKHVDKNLSLQKSLEVKPFLRERKPTSTKTARFGTYVLDKHEFTAQPYVIDIALDDSDVISVDTANNSGSQSDIIQPFNYSPSLVCTNEKSKEGRHLVEKKKPKNVTKTSSIINQNSWAIPTAGNTSNQNKSSSAPSTPVHKTQNTSSSNSSLSKSRCSRPLLGKKSSTFTAGESSMRGRDENNQKDVIGRKTNFLKTKSSVKTSPNRNNKLRSKSESKNDGVENHIEKPTKTRLTLDERQTKDTPSNRKNKDTPSNRKNRDTPLNRKNKDTSSYPKNKDTPSDRKNKDTPSNRKNKDTPSNRKPFLKRTSTSYTDKLSDKKDPPKSKKNQEIGEPLTERLASLRVQLEQKRLKFEEEKKRQQELWNQQRAKILQDAFFVMINGKENEDPSHLPESIDVATTPSAKQNASRELQLDANRDRKCKTEGEERSTKSKRESPREFVQRKREEKQKEMQSVEQQNLWFVGFDEEAKNDNSKAKNEKIKNEKLSNSANMINVNKENRGIFEKVTKLNNIDDLGEHMECELANDTVSFESERIQGEEKTNTYSLMGMANSTPPQTTELNDTSLLIKQIPTKEHIEPKIESECQTEQISKLTQISQANDDTVSQGISKPLSQLKALNSNTSKIIAKSAEMSNKIEIKIRKSESENNDLIGVKLLNTGIHPVKSYAYDEDISGDISGIVPSNSLKTEQDKETDEDKNLTARKSLSDTSNALFEEKDKWEQVIAEQATVTDNYQVSGQTTTPTDLLQSGVFTGYSTIQNPIGETFLVVDNPSIAKHQVNNYVTETKNTTDSTGFVKRFQHFSVNEETDPSYLTSTPMKRQDIESRTPQARTQENGIKVDNVFADQQPSEHSIGESDTSTTPKAKAWGVSFGDDFVGADTGLTPDQERKRSRFLKSRMKKMEESRKKKEEENEKQRLKEEELALEKEKLEDEEKLRRERLMEEKLAEATRQLQEVDFSKRLHGLTYNMDPQPTSERRKEQRQLQSPSQRNNIRAISPTSMRTVSPLEPEETNVYAEYKGPSAYQKPSGKSNRKIIQNAIMHCCLCGEVNKEAKEKCLETVSQSDASHFLVLFREGLKFKSVYEYRPETETVTRIYGIGPKTITSKMHSSYFKYNSGGKHFNALETKHLSIQVDGVMIKKELWEKKPTSSKPNSNPRKKPPMTLKPAR